MQRDACPAAHAGLLHKSQCFHTCLARPPRDCYNNITTTHKGGDMTTTQRQDATDPDGPTGRLATWVAGLTLDDIPRDVIDRAAHLLLDGLGCGLIGAQLSWS